MRAAGDRIRWLLGIPVALAFGVFGLAAARKAVHYARCMGSEAATLARPHAERRLDAYDEAGFHIRYIERVVALLPDPDLMPAVEYADQRPDPAALLLALRRRRDARVLIGIGVPPSVTATAYICAPGAPPTPALPEGYTVVHRGAKGFTAVRADLLDAARARGDRAWLEALDRLDRDRDRDRDR